MTNKTIVMTINTIVMTIKTIVMTNKTIVMTMNYLDGSELLRTRYRAILSDSKPVEFGSNYHTISNNVNILRNHAVSYKMSYSILGYQYLRISFSILGYKYIRISIS
jgi:hypothetical protein